MFIKPVSAFAALAALSLTACATTDGSSTRLADTEDMGDGVICETQYTTGSRLNPQRVCTTAEDRARMKDDADSIYRNVNDNRRVPDSRNPGRE